MKSYMFGNADVKQFIEIIDSINYSNDGYPTSNCVAKGNLNKIFFKQLNEDKIYELFKGDYLELFNEYYKLINKVIKTNKIFGIIEKDGCLYEFSELLDKNKFLDNGNIFDWNEILILFDKLLSEINNCIMYNYSSEEKIGFETAIWNFTIDGILFDLDPPKILKKGIDTTFTRKKDINHMKRTLYRSFDEIGMKFNLLVTLILGEKHNSFIVKNQPDNYIEFLINKIIKSSTNEVVYKKIIEDLTIGVRKTENFVGHPIEIVRREIMIREKANDKVFVFVAGTSESGKSGGINYLKSKYPEVQHIKIRDIFPMVYKDTFSKLTFEEWQNIEEMRDLNNFWRLFVNKVFEIVDDRKKIIVLDTMYGVDGMIELYNILKEKVNLLYIDAPFEQRVIREYNRLRTDSINGIRKADLNITIEDVTERTLKKDKKKNKKGADKLPKLSYSLNQQTIGVDSSGNLFATIINNDGTIEEFYEKLDNYMELILNKTKKHIMELKK